MATEKGKNAEDGYIKMDYSLNTIEARRTKVEEIIANTPSEKLTPLYLDRLAKYLLDVTMDKTEKKKSYNILNDNRMIWINKREMSFEGLIGKLENGEDGIYNMIANDKNIIFTPKQEGITQSDINNIPGMKDLVDAITEVEKQKKNARGKRAYLIGQQLKEMRQDQYVLKGAYKKPMYMMNLKKSLSKLDLSEKVYLDENGEVKSTGLINLYDPNHISILLCNYSFLKQDTWDKFNSDTKWLLLDLENVIDNALEEKYPLYYDLLIYKIDGLSNLQIQEKLFDKYGIKHSVEYISSLWRNKIPKLIAEEAANEWLIWHFTYEEDGKWKKCSRCGQIKLAHNHFFSKNNTSRDHFYSICKECRNKKNKGAIKIQKKG